MTPTISPFEESGSQNATSGASQLEGQGFSSDDNTSPEATNPRYGEKYLTANWSTYMKSWQ